MSDYKEMTNTAGPQPMKGDPPPYQMAAVSTPANPPPGQTHLGYPNPGAMGQVNPGYAYQTQAVVTAAPVTQVTVISQLLPGAYPQHVRDWSSEIIKDCQCCNDPAICVYGFFCGPCLSAQNAKRIGEECCYGFMCEVAVRARVRGMYGMKGSGCEDCCCHIWCYRCSVCQLTRELDNLGVPGPKFLCC